MENLIKNIRSLIDVNDHVLTRTLSCFEKIQLDKGADFRSYGKIASSMQFIEQGLVRVFFLDDSLKEITVQIGIENNWINNLYSFINGVTNEFYTEILAPTTIYQLHKSKFEKLLNDVPKMEPYFRLKLEQSYSRLHNRAYGQLNKTAEEKYLTFREHYGHIEQLVPQYIIASYLNISPEHLSKIRKQLSSH
ncbi:MAG: Crp/Fnr family transcriptional regulator [Flavipsychrobacter sp.]